MKNLLKSLLALVVFIALANFSKAQDVEQTPFDTLAANVAKLNSTVGILDRIKITGYIQAQYQKIDSAGAASFAGGNFGKDMDNRIGVRRGRVKFAYTGKYSMAVAQFDITEKGFATKDIYMVFREPWLQALNFTAGVFNRPFGYEVSYSSSSRESPERSRFTQTLFPQERDLGGMFTFQMPKTSRWNWIKIDAGWFAGNGINVEVDKKRDFIGRAGIAKPFFNEKVKLGLGASINNGFVYQGTKYVFNSKTDANGVKYFAMDSTSSKISDFAKRQYYGIDAQLSIESPLGITTLRGEYVWGKQPGTSSSSTSPTYTALPTSDIYNRKVKGTYFYFIQQLGNSKHSIVMKYDTFDPNTEVSGDEIGKSLTGVTSKDKKTGVADLAYNTLGLGYIFAYTSNVRFMLYYDIVKNEKSSNLGIVNGYNYRKDIKDNVLTLRFQYKF